MTNGEKFKEIFGFGTDGSRVIAVNSTWWDCEFQNSKPITKRVPTADMRADELVETIRKQCYYMDCGNCNTCVKLKAADVIETLYAAYTESFSIIVKAFRNNPKDSVLREYMMKNACCCDEEEGET